MIPFADPGFKPRQCFPFLVSCFTFTTLTFLGRSRYFLHRISFNFWFLPMRVHRHDVGRFYYGSGILSSPMYSKGRHTVAVYSTLGKVKTHPSVYVYYSYFSTEKGTWVIIPNLLLPDLFKQLLYWWLILSSVHWHYLTFHRLKKKIIYIVSATFKLNGSQWNLVRLWIHFCCIENSFHYICT